MLGIRSLLSRLHLHPSSPPMSIIRSLSLSRSISTSPSSYTLTSTLMSRPLLPRSSSIFISNNITNLSLSSSSSSPSPITSRLTSSPYIYHSTRNNLMMPRRRKFRKAFKGHFPYHLGGSTRGSTVIYGDWGLRLKEGARLTAKQLETFRILVRRFLKPVKDSKLYFRIFTDRPVTSKGAESRMGKGKGTLDYWATWVPKNKVIMEVGGGGLRYETAVQALKAVATGLPSLSEIIAKEVPSGTLPPPKKLVPRFAKVKAQLEKDTLDVQKRKEALLARKKD